MYIPFIAAHLEDSAAMKALVDTIYRYYPYVPKKDLGKFMDNYKFYFKLEGRAAAG